MLVSTLLLASLPVSQSAIADIARAEQERLNICIELADTNPNDAYEDSLAWLASGNRPKARYCNAVALLALEKYEEGAARLEALANAPDPISLEDRALYMTQAGNAWLTANYPEAALTAFDAALNMQRGNPDLYKDRAAAYLALERWIEGVDDLNAALDLVPTDAEALAMRARAHLETENFDAAMADMQAALSQDPENLDILVLRGEIREAIRISRDTR
jgi:tetratricopeptide (TPR) repeat protein